jgi:hypothetical protein
MSGPIDASTPTPDVKVTEPTAKPTEKPTWRQRLAGVLGIGGKSAADAGKPEEVVAMHALAQEAKSEPAANVHESSDVAPAAEADSVAPATEVASEGNEDGAQAAEANTEVTLQSDAVVESDEPSAEDQTEKKLDEYAGKLEAIAKGAKLMAPDVIKDLQKDAALFGENMVIIGEGPMQVVMFRQPETQTIIDDVMIDAASGDGATVQVGGEKTTKYDNYLFLKPDGTLAFVTVTPEQRVQLDNPTDGQLIPKLHTRDRQVTDQNAKYTVDQYLSEGNISTSTGQEAAAALAYIFKEKKYPTDNEVSDARRYGLESEREKNSRVLWKAQEIGRYLTGQTKIDDNWQHRYYRSARQGNSALRGKQSEHSLGFFDPGYKVESITDASINQFGDSMKDTLQKNVVSASESTAA